MKILFACIFSLLSCIAAEAQTINVHGVGSSVTKLSSGDVNFIEFEESNQSTGSVVVLKQTNGDTSVYSFSDSPQIRYADNKVKLTTSKTSVELEADNVDRIYLSQGEKDDLSVEALEADVVRYFIADGQLVVSGLEAGAVVSVYTVDGTLLVSRSAGTDGKVSLALPKSQNGIFVVKANNQTFKIIVK